VIEEYIMSECVPPCKERLAALWEDTQVLQLLWGGLRAHQQSEHVHDA